MEVRDVERVARGGEACRLVEARGVHAPTSGFRVDEHDPPSSAVRDEHPPARVDDDRIRVANCRLDRRARVGCDGTVAAAGRREQRGGGQRDDGDPDDLHRDLYTAARAGVPGTGGIVTPSSRSRDILVRRHG